MTLSLFQWFSVSKNFWNQHLIKTPLDHFVLKKNFDLKFTIFVPEKECKCMESDFLIILMAAWDSSIAKHCNQWGILTYM